MQNETRVRELLKELGMLLMSEQPAFHQQHKDALALLALGVLTFQASINGNPCCVMMQEGDSETIN